MAIKNRYEVLFYVECINGNPNGDPDMGNSPRVDPQDMHGLITDVALKRRVRNYIQYAYGNKERMNIIIQNATNINKFIALAHEKANSDSKDKSKDKVDAARKWVCDNYYDVRAFGAVLSTGANAGQVRGAVQMAFGRSIDPILPLDISITRMAVTEDLKGSATFEQYQKWEDEMDESKLRTMGRKQLISYGLYECRAFISANLAEKTGFNEEDLGIFFKALLNMYEHDRSASKGQMSVISPLIIFKHIGTDSDEGQRIRQAKLGCAPAHKLFELVRISRKEDVEIARTYKDYTLTIDLDNVPKGVAVGFKMDAYQPTQWGMIPSECSWIKKYE